MLSSNDGCIVALTPEAKALGLRRGDPIFQKKEVVEQAQVKLFSTNMMLYTDIPVSVGIASTKTLAKLNYLGITTLLEFADRKESWVRSHFTKPGLQTWKELNGVPCIDTTEVAQRQSWHAKSELRSGNYLSDIQEILTIRI